MKRLLAIAAAALLLAGCASTTPDPSQPRALTTEEAQLLAVARFQNYDSGTREVSITVPGSEGLDLTGWIDFVDHEGYATATDPATTSAVGLLAWNLTTIAARDGAPPAQTLPAPGDGWQSGALDASSSSLHNALLVSLNLGSDRPDNPQLLQQTDARWLRADSIDGTPVIVIAGPSTDAVATADPTAGSETTRFWIDSTGRLLRFESRQSASSKDWSVIDLGDTQTVDFGAIPGIESAG